MNQSTWLSFNNRKMKIEELSSFYTKRERKSKKENFSQIQCTVNWKHDLKIDIIFLLLFLLFSISIGGWEPLWFFPTRAHQEENHFKGADFLLSGTCDEPITIDKHRIYVCSFWQPRKKGKCSSPKAAFRHNGFSGSELSRDLTCGFLC